MIKNINKVQNFFSEFAEYAFLASQQEKKEDFIYLLNNFVESKDIKNNYEIKDKSEIQFGDFIIWETNEEWETLGIYLDNEEVFDIITNKKINVKTIENFIAIDVIKILEKVFDYKNYIKKFISPVLPYGFSIREQKSNEFILDIRIVLEPADGTVTDSQLIDIRRQLVLGIKKIFGPNKLSSNHFGTFNAIFDINHKDFKDFIRNNIDTSDNTANPNIDIFLQQLFTLTNNNIPTRNILADISSLIDIDNINKEQPAKICFSDFYTYSKLKKIGNDQNWSETFLDDDILAFNVYICSRPNSRFQDNEIKPYIIKSQDNMNYFYPTQYIDNLNQSRYFENGVLRQNFQTDSDSIKKIPSGTTFRNFYNTRNLAGGEVIFLVANPSNTGTNISQVYLNNYGVSGFNAERRLGLIFSNEVGRNNEDFNYTAIHELCHVLGLADRYFDSTSGSIELSNFLPSLIPITNYGNLLTQYQFISNSFMPNAGSIITNNNNSQMALPRYTIPLYFETDKDYLDLFDNNRPTGTTMVVGDQHNLMADPIRSNNPVLTDWQKTIILNQWIETQHPILANNLQIIIPNTAITAQLQVQKGTDNDGRPIFNMANGTTLITMFKSGWDNNVDGVLRENLLLSSSSVFRNGTNGIEDILLNWFNTLSSIPSQSDIDNIVQNYINSNPLPRQLNNNDLPPSILNSDSYALGLALWNTPQTFNIPLNASDGTSYNFLGTLISYNITLYPNRLQMR